MVNSSKKLFVLVVAGDRVKTELNWLVTVTPVERVFKVFEKELPSSETKEKESEGLNEKWFVMSGIIIITVSPFKIGKATFANYKTTKT